MDSPRHRDTLVLHPKQAAERQIALWLAAMDDARTRTLETLDQLSPAELDLDHPDSNNSIGTLLYHIAVIEADWLYAEVLVTDFPAEAMALFPHDVRDGSGRLTPVRGVPLGDHLDRLQTVRGLLIEVFESMTLDDFFRVRELPPYDVTPAWVLHHLLQHEAEHRGEIRMIRSRLQRGA